MPTTLIPGIILDSRGAPMAPHGGRGALLRRTRNDNRLRPPPPSHYADRAALLAPRTYREQVSEARALAARGVVSALISSKAGYVSASHFRPTYHGTDDTFGTAALQWLTEALKISNIRGNRFTWAASWGLSTENFADSGGYFVLLTKWPDTAQPALQFIEAHRIGQRDDEKNIVEPTDAFTDITDADGTSRRVRGAYAGAKIHQGIITNDYGTEVAARILGPTKDTDQDVSLRDLIYVAAPKAYSEVRPLPDLSAGALDFLALQMAQDSQLDLHIGDARRDVIEKTVTGRRDIGADLTGMNGDTTTEAGTPTDVVERGGIRIIKSSSDITPFESNRPSDPWMNFDERVLKRAARSVRWFAEMLDPASITGSSNRALQDQVNTCIFADFYAVAPAIERAIRYFVAVGQQNGDLPPSDQWRQFSVAIPPEFRIDRQSARIDLEEYQAGRTSMSILMAQDGHSAREVMQQRANDYKLAADIAAKAGVPVEVILGQPAQPSAPPPSPRDNPQP